MLFRSGGLLIGLRYAAALVVSPIGGWLADRFGADRLQVICGALYAVGFALVALTWVSTTIAPLAGPTDFGTERTVALVEAAGGRAFAYRADVADAAAVDAMVAETVRRYGRLDIVVNNAAITDAHRDWTEVTEEEWDRALAVNLKGCFLTMKAAYPHLLAGGHGRVINIASVTFLTGQGRLLDYVASKGGMIGFTRTLARDVGKDGITVNAITPGAILTEAELTMFPDQEAVQKLLAGLQSIPRRGLPEDIANAVVFLASDEASFITGQTLSVSGGVSMV